MFGIDKQVKQRINNLESHLKNESPILVDTVKCFRQLDKIAYKTGLLNKDQTYTTQIPWWPLISILGTFSAGKSTFINHYLGVKLQETGTQAVDDKFTVICYTAEDEPRVLPGIALESDPRFPFYHIAEEIDRVSAAEGGRVNSYLQMKTCNSEKLRGNIFIDSPGFDADEQRTATLKITDYMIDLSDLVLVFFDARHPEPGAMRDTLKHLVGDKINKNNADKFLYILNQIDASAREDNPEDVVASWQRALATEGLTAGKFYTIYNPDAAVTIEDDTLRERFEKKRDEDLAEIHKRIEEVDVIRLYRIIGALDKTVREIEMEQIPLLDKTIHQWMKGTLIRDAILSGSIAVLILALFIVDNPLSAMLADLSGWVTADQTGMITALIVFLGLFTAIHFWSRKLSCRSQLKKLKKSHIVDSVKLPVINAFKKNARFIHSIFRPNPVGWNFFTRRRLKNLMAEADSFIQSLNDKYARPSGEAVATETKEDQAEMGNEIIGDETVIEDLEENRDKQTV